MAEGITFSDLHLFSPQCRAEKYLPEVYDALADYRCLVLNGDIFDFEWTYHPTIEHAADAAIAWLQALRDDFPQLEIHYVLGNHDCHRTFLERLTPWTKTVAKFKWHPFYTRIDSALFVHGDFTSWPMSPPRFAAYRAKCADVQRKSNRQRGLLNVAHAAGLMPLVHRALFPRPLVIGRLIRFLQAYDPKLLDSVSDVYFGHTHLPFRGYRAGLLSFHNSGSAMGSMGFQPQPFPLTGTPAVAEEEARSRAGRRLAREWS